MTSAIQVNGTALYLLIGTAIVLVATVVWLIVLRRALITSQHLMVPEEWGRVISKVVETTEHHGTGIKALNDRVNSIARQAQDLMETTLTLHTALNERDGEIRRLRSGYDAVLFRRFSSRFVKVDQLLRDIDPSKVTENDIRLLGDVLGDALDECGIERFEPAIGSDYRTEVGVADNPRKTSTDKPHLAYEIEKVLMPGYRLRGGDQPIVLVPAKVQIFVLEDKEG